MEGILILCKLDTDWDKVKLQTGWTLQRCYMPAGCNEEQPSPRTNSSMQLQPATPCASSQQPQPEHHAVNISITSQGEATANPGPENDEMATDLTRDTNSVGQTTEIISPTHSPTDPFLDPQTHHHPSPH